MNLPADMFDFTKNKEEKDFCQLDFGLSTESTSGLHDMSPVDSNTAMMDTCAMISDPESGTKGSRKSGKVTAAVVNDVTMAVAGDTTGSNFPPNNGIYTENCSSDHNGHSSAQNDVQHVSMPHCMNLEESSLKSCSSNGDESTLRSAHDNMITCVKGDEMLRDCDMTMVCDSNSTKENSISASKLLSDKTPHDSEHGSEHCQSEAPTFSGGSTSVNDPEHADKPQTDSAIHLTCDTSNTHDLCTQKTSSQDEEICSRSRTQDADTACHCTEKTQQPTASELLRSKFNAGFVLWSK